MAAQGREKAEASWFMSWLGIGLMELYQFSYDLLQGVKLGFAVFKGNIKYVLWLVPLVLKYEMEVSYDFLFNFRDLGWEIVWYIESFSSGDLKLWSLARCGYCMILSCLNGDAITQPKSEG